MEHKRLTLFAGHYGSGKTNIALNYAMHLKSLGFPAVVADMDIVNPYFRTKDSEEELNSHGIELICSSYANSNVDLPSLPKEIYSLIADKERFGVLDIGGDDRGALALGRYVPAIKEDGDYELLLVINRSRPMTRTAEDAIGIMKEIEFAAGLSFTGIVNNTNLGLKSTAETLLSSLDYAYEVSRMAGIPIKMHCAEESICKQLEDRVGPIFPLRIQKLYYMTQQEV